MTLWLSATSEYVNPYYTNRNYLRNLTSLQMKFLKEMEWDEDYEYIRDSFSVWFVPDAWPSKTGAWNSMERFISDLNRRIMGL